MEIMFGVNGTEMVILVIVALVVIGPKRLPEYAQKLRDLVRQLIKDSDVVIENFRPGRMEVLLNCGPGLGRGNHRHLHGAADHAGPAATFGCKAPLLPKPLAS